MTQSRCILISWIGANDLNSLTTTKEGPVISTLRERSFDRVYLLYNYPQAQVESYSNHLNQLFPKNSITYTQCDLSSPTDFADIFSNASKELENVNISNDEQLNILLSPGTPAMQAVWILLGKTKYPAKFLQSSIEQGVQDVEIPFDISAEFIPSLVKTKRSPLEIVLDTDVPIDAAFENIITQNPHMLELKKKASVIAQHDIPVLIQGETGTGKELFATAIHNASDRKNKPFVTINCGAIPPELIDSILFGHKKGAFTGAIADTKGAFENADGGTLFLDEFGELPKAAQVRMLRAIQFGEIKPVGASDTKTVDVRIIAATNRDLMIEVSENRFREDLFYRIAVGVITLPGLRERKGDIALLIDKLMTDINKQFRLNLSGKDKIISPKGKNILISHSWPGNIRELYSTLLRSFLWANNNVITDDDIKSSLFVPVNKTQGILDREIDNNFNIHDVMSELVGHYINKALAESDNNLTQAAQKLGLASYQTLKSWMDKYQVN